MRRIGVITAGRSDYGIYRSVLRELSSLANVDLQILATGMHLSSEFGLSIHDIESDGYNISARIETLLSADTPSGIAKAIGLGVIGFSQVYAESDLDMLVVLGDRFEMYAGALASLPFQIPIAHIHGGEVTEGAIDDALRHSLTKLSHLHFASTQRYANRIKQLGEEEWRITVSGAPSLDNLHLIEPLNQVEIQDLLGIDLESPPLLVTYHPVTLEYRQATSQARELLASLEQFQRPIIFTLPNADTAGREIANSVRDFVASHPNARLANNLGTKAYFGLMRLAAAMVGNSSSGLIEAPSFELPVVNIGTRQDGRIRGPNVIDVGNRREEIVSGITKAISPKFRSSLSGLKNPYGSGNASAMIARTLCSVPLNERLLRKRFCDNCPQ